MAYTVVSHQDLSFKLEELLAETGVELAVVPLRKVLIDGEWLRSPIRSRIWDYKSIADTWPEHAPRFGSCNRNANVGHAFNCLYTPSNSTLL